MVPLLVRERFPAELCAAVLDDETGVPALLVVCEGIDAGDAATISVVFRELAGRLVGQPSEVAEVLHSATPAAVFAAKVRTQFTSWTSD